MRKILGLMLFVSLVICSAACADGNTVAKDNGVDAKTNYYADGVPAVTLDRAADRQVVSKEAVEMQNVIEQKTSTIRPGAKAVQDIKTLEVTPTVDTIKADSGVIYNMYFADIGNMKDVSGTWFTGNAVFTYNPDGSLQGISYSSLGDINSYTGNIGASISMGNFSYSNAVTITSNSSGSIVATSYVPMGSFFSIIEGSIDVGATEVQVINGGPIQLNQGGSIVSVTRTEETVSASKNDEAKILGIKNRQDKQSKAMKKLVGGKSIIDEE
ncbi:MAG: hypothetical protein NTZ95_08465 [Candidatus Omnitrophica bacterium]|nr:hypothetical protein [Candidatus Omnitrophota bacterium]